MAAVPTAEAGRYPTGYGMSLLALLDSLDPPPAVTVVLGERSDAEKLPLLLPAESAAILREPSGPYPLKNGKTTFYVCRGRRCLPPVNVWPE